MKGILFKPEMIQAILLGNKTMTRRIIKSKTGFFCVEHNDNLAIHGNCNGKIILETDDEEMETGNTILPAYEIGEIIFIREAHYRYGKWVKNSITKIGKQKWSFRPDKQFNEIRYLDNPPAKIEKNNHRGIGQYKRSPLFMPAKAARIFLQIENVKCERIQDISEEDAIKERIVYEETYSKYNNQKIFRTKDFVFGGYHESVVKNIAVESFGTLIDYIHGKEVWEENKWCFAYEFKQINKPDNL